MFYDTLGRRGSCWWLWLYWPSYEYRFCRNSGSTGEVIWGLGSVGGKWDMSIPLSVSEWGSIQPYS